MSKRRRKLHKTRQRQDQSPPGEPSRREFLQQSASNSLGAVGGLGMLGGLAGSAVAQTTSAEPRPPERNETLAYTLRVNGQEHPVKLDPRVTLLDALRERLGLTGTKKGCDHGQCGACTVLVEGRRIYSCLTLAVMHAGQAITTIEGLADGEQLHPVQAAFVHRDAFQCGYCTPGQICSAVGLLHEGHAHTDAEVRELMSGNICRCGAYPNIVAAIQDARRVQINR